MCHCDIVLLAYKLLIVNSYHDIFSSILNKFQASDICNFMDMVDSK
ncbi:hypothetical protein AGMMS49950_09810 [Endomicrobiia bacterium]|nr:hypothetical protein AGMMS49950_09810 [Endomicrobiia bacterium]